MKSSLEKLVTKKVAATKTAEAAKAEAERKKEEEFRAKLPKTFEERCKLIYPSICDGDKWKVYFAAGHWRLNFKVGKLEFEIHDEYAQYDAGTPTEGYGPTEAHWYPALHVKDLNGSRMFMLGSVKEVNDGYIAGRFDAPSKDKDGRVYWKPMEKFEENVKETNDDIAKQVEEVLLHADDYQWWRRFDRRW